MKGWWWLHIGWICRDGWAERKITHLVRYRRFLHFLH
jgi:hypothetical protein